MKLDQKGVILPLMLGICLLCASLLLNYAHHLERQAASLQMREAFLTISFLEKEAIQGILDALAENPDPAQLPAYLMISQETAVSLTSIESEAGWEIGFQFGWQGFTGQGRLHFQPDEHHYRLQDCRQEICS